MVLIALYVVSLHLVFSLNPGMICKLCSEHGHWEWVLTINSQFGHTPAHRRTILPCLNLSKHLWEPIIYLLQNFGQVPTVCRIKCKFLTLAFNKTLVTWSHCYFYSFPVSYYHPSLNLCPNLPWLLIIPKYYFFLYFLPCLFILFLWIPPPTKVCFSSW